MGVRSFSVLLWLAISAVICVSVNAQSTSANPEIDCSSCNCIYVQNLAPFDMSVSLAGAGIWPSVSTMTTSTIVPGDDYPLKFCVTEGNNYYVYATNSSWPSNSKPHVLHVWTSGSTNRNPWVAYDSGRNQGYFTHNEADNSRVNCGSDQAINSTGNSTTNSTDGGIGFPIANNAGSTQYNFQTYWDTKNWPCSPRFNSIWKLNDGDSTSVSGPFAWGSNYWLAVGDDPTTLNGGFVHQKYTLYANSNFCRPKLYYDSANNRYYLLQDNSC